MQDSLITLKPREDNRSRTLGSLNEDIAKYYAQSYWDYRTAWFDNENLALHYGHWEDGIRTHSEALINKNRLLAETAGIKDGESVLDAGCGIGGSSIWLAKAYNVNVTGVSVTPEQIAMARKNAEQRGLSDRVKFEVADFIHTPFPDASFDVMWCCETICYAVDKRDLMREALRVLKPGGRLVCSDGYATKRQYTADEWQPVIACLDGWEVPNLAMVDEFESDLNEVGFENIQHWDYTENVMPSARRMWLTAVTTHPMHWLMSKVGLRTRGQIGNFQVAINQYRLFKDRLTTYEVFLAHKPK